jgi:hypothetical protein
MSATPQPEASAPPSMNRLLAFFDADRTRAEAKYAQVRLRLLKLFAWRRCVPPESFVDQTVERVGRRLAAGNDRQVAEPFQYFYSVAMGIAREHRPLAEPEPPPVEEPAPDPATPADPNAAPPETKRPPKDPVLLAQAQQRMPVLASTLRELLPQYRRLLTDYHRRHRSANWLEEFEQTYGAPDNVLRLRVHRLRAGVERSVNAQLRQRAEEAAAAATAAATPPQEGLLT